MFPIQMGCFDLFKQHTTTIQGKVNQLQYIYNHCHHTTTALSSLRTIIIPVECLPLLNGVEERKELFAVMVRQ